MLALDCTKACIFCQHLSSFRRFKMRQNRWQCTDDKPKPVCHSYWKDLSSWKMPLTDVCALVNWHWEHGSCMPRISYIKSADGWSRPSAGKMYGTARSQGLGDTAMSTINKADGLLDDKPAWLMTPRVPLNNCYVTVRPRVGDRPMTARCSASVMTVLTIWQSRLLWLVCLICVTVPTSQVTVLIRTVHRRTVAIFVLFYKLLWAFMKSQHIWYISVLGIKWHVN